MPRAKTMNDPLNEKNKETSGERWGGPSASLKGWDPANPATITHWMALPLRRQFDFASAERALWLETTASSGAACPPDRKLVETDFTIVGNVIESVSADHRALYALSVEELLRTTGFQLTVSDASSKLGVSPDRFRHLLLQWTGFNRRFFVLHVRMRRAASLLRSPSVPVKEVARQCGYGGTANLSRDFAAYLSFRIRQYRNKWTDFFAESDVYS